MDGENSFEKILGAKFVYDSQMNNDPLTAKDINILGWDLITSSKLLDRPIETPVAPRYKLADALRIVTNHST